MQSDLMSNLMKPSRLRRGAAVLLLALAFVDLTLIDLAFPQLCNDERMELAGAGPIESAEQASDESGTINTHDSEPGQNSQPLSTDEDCFCCCSHILLGYPINEVTLNTPPRISLPSIKSLPSPPSQDTFHPPRFA